MKSKLAIYSHVLPPSSSGQAIVLYRLLEKFPAEDYILISSADYSKETKGKLPAKYYQLKTPEKAREVIREYKKKPLIKRLASFVATVRAHSRDLRKILTKENVGTLVICSGGFFDMSAAYLAIRGLKLRLVIYSFDDFLYQWTGILRVVARVVSGGLFRRADKLIVANEFLKISYDLRYFKKSVIVRNPYLSQERLKTKRFFNKNQLNIVYTGSVYFAHFDAFQNLVRAMELIKMPVCLHLFSDQNEQELAEKGISGNRLKFHGHLSQGEIYSIQKEADILFLPLAFKSRIKETVRTSAPGKMGEYLATGKPILVHAPRDSFVSWYCRLHECAAVVDVNNPKKLAGRILAMAKNKTKSREMAKKAQERARVDFSVERARASFGNVIAPPLKILLLTPTYPQKNSSGAIMLRDLCELILRDKIYCFVARDPLLKNADYPEIKSIVNREIVKRPIESPYGFPNWFFDHPLSELIEKLKDIYVRFWISGKAVRYGKRHEVDCIWAVLQGKTMISTALPVAERLKRPLIVQVWDEPEWILSSTGISSARKDVLLAKFKKTVERSLICAAASSVMAKNYSREFKVETITFLGSLNEKMALKPREHLRPGSELKIGFAGQIYALQEWEALIGALASVGWKILGRRVKIFILGDTKFGQNRIFKSNVYMKGYKTQSEAITYLSKMDLLYCPYWFDRSFKKIAETSFPSKLATYFAAGRPVLFHGPAYSSPAKFMAENSCGELCYSLEEKEILAHLESLVADSRKYAKLARAGADAFRKHLTHKVLGQELNKFLAKAKENLRQ